LAALERRKHNDFPGGTARWHTADILSKSPGIHARIIQKSVNCKQKGRPKAAFLAKMREVQAAALVL
jgi:hypothetical protein